MEPNNYYMQPWQMTQPSVNIPRPMPNTQAMQNSPLPMQSAFKLIPVASYDEAIAVPTDFMGNMLLMPDLSHGFIYTKVFNPNTGGSIFNRYKYIPPDTQPEEKPDDTPKIDYVPLADFEALKAELNRIKEELGITDKEGK